MTISQILAHTILSYAASGMTPEAAFDKVAGFMARRGLLGYGPAVRRELLALGGKARAREAIRIYSPFPLDQEIKDGIRAKYGKDAAHAIDEVVDPKYIGGFRAEHDHRYYDATYLSALEKLKERLLQR